MKFQKWFTTILIFVGALGATALASAPLNEDAELTDALRTLKSTQASSAVWPELEKFQASLWKSMALDPGPVTLVPVKQVPKELFAEELTNDLNQQLETLKQSHFPRTAHAQNEFDQYLQIVRKILAHRISRQWPQARAFAKRGTLDEAYAALIKKVNASAPEAVTARDESVKKIETYIQSTKESKVVPEIKKTVFNNGNQFIWAALIALIGFAFGITAIKMHPEFFEKFISSSLPVPKPAPAATTTHQLNYARWLREFEELLAKLKATQLTHERRIEEVFKHSEKMNQFATALYTDPRIKNEANLEFRMSSLLREMHQQLEQTHELKAGDRAPIHVTLEHCLKLCDAIENGSIQIEQPGAQPPGGNPNTKSAI